ncbi:hypothetical protein D9Q98_006584 [Chlorella vulgaris]|uniref:Cytochrome b5 heme-binding domain-containing protein n=1 Tax=Chlorella vulgaris TaxID=3077 RepID=A0A9D4YVD6_CHLVU|nr:hypothetical protein D9Q98_006584 [Chlorella vulgaris]
MIKASSNAAGLPFLPANLLGGLLCLHRSQSKSGSMATTTMEPESAAETSVPQAKTITLAECQGHMSDKDCWLVVDGKVYDVTPFLDEHPGGFDTLVSNSGKDATEDFDEIGHSRAAKEMLAKYYIGDYAGGASRKASKAAPAVSGAEAASSTLSSLLKALLPILIVLAAVYYLQLTQQAKAAA